MSSFWRTFILWFMALLAVVVFANWPRDAGALKPEFVWMGFPWTFAHWVSGRLLAFDMLAFFGDILVNLGLVGAIAFLCAFVRHRHRGLQ